MSIKTYSVKIKKASNNVEETANYVGLDQWQCEQAALGIKKNVAGEDDWSVVSSTEVT